MNEPWAKDQDYTRYTLWFIFACIIYSIIGFSWGAIVGMIPDLRDFIFVAVALQKICCVHYNCGAKR